MKAMVLAAGLGLRMRPLTLVRAKPVLPVLNRPLLHWTLERLARHGVTDVIVNLHHLPQTVTDAVGDGGAFGLRVRYSREERILGTGGGPRAVRETFGDEPFLLVNGDVLFDFDLRALMARHRSGGARVTLALLANPDPRVYGPIVTDRTGQVLSLAGRPRRSRGTVSLFTGVHAMDPSLLDLLPDGPSDSVLDLYVPLVAAGGRVDGMRVRGRWYDFGRPRLYRDTQLRLLPGRGRDRALLHPQAQVRAHARVRRSVVGDGTRVESGAQVDRSVLWDGAVVEEDASVEGAIVTTGAIVGRGEAARDVVVLPETALRRDTDAGGRVEIRNRMAWVTLK
ncbi:MAG: NDP-sugar synthase [Acidobacteria bacterium]|jgi:NDP-sugar pyrophosphorylase family protein|nr:NDP-sugar synthase [Acidobacteriota bacterium]